MPGTGTWLRGSRSPTLGISSVRPAPTFRDVTSVREMAKKARPLVRRTGWDVVPYPGIRHQRLRAKTLEHLGVDLVLDVGANIGQFGGDVRAFGYTGDMVSYEPMREAFTQLEGKAAGDPRWTPVRSAIGAKAGELELHIAGNSI